MIIFGTLDGNLRRVSAEGGTPTPITTVDESLGETRHDFPEFLPDGRHFLYLAAASETENSKVYVGDLDSDLKVPVQTAASRVAFALPGYLLFQREGVLYAQVFDAENWSLGGEPMRVAENIFHLPQLGFAEFTVSDTDVLAYIPDAGSQIRRLVWYDRSGRMGEPFGSPTTARWIRLSPDGRRVAFTDVTDDGGEDLFVYDLDRNMANRLTVSPAVEHGPVWSPDSLRLGFDSDRGETDLHVPFEMQANGAIPASPLFQPEPGMNRGLYDWSMDGRWLVFHQDLTESVTDETDLADLWILPLFGDGEPLPYLTTSFTEGQAVLSPNGQWLAYVSNQTGVYEVVVQPFPDPSRERWRISTDGGAYPRWKRDGRELYYLHPEGQIMAVPVVTEGNFQHGTPVPLIEARLRYPQGLFVPQPWSSVSPYEVTPDGERFLVLQPIVNTVPVTVVVNWTSLLENE